MSDEPVTKQPDAPRHRSHAAVNSRPKRNPFTMTPLIAGVVALGLAAGGAVAATNAGGSDSGYDATSYDASTYGREGTSVSRGNGRDEAPVAREVTARQAAQQAKQRTAAAEQLAEQRTAALAALASGSNARNKSLRKAAVKRAQRAANQWVLPVAGYRLTARFGQSSSLWSTVHTGLDFAAPQGTKIISVAQGTVTKVGNAGAYGNQTIVTLENGTEIWYNHQSATSVTVGQKVNPGDEIGAVGSTGNVTGPHLHLEVRPGGGEPIDPFAELTKHNVKP